MLRDRKALKRLTAIETKLTPKGIAAFRTARPDCELIVADPQSSPGLRP